MGNASDSSMPRIGVSPAYFISRFGDRFSAHQVAAAMTDIAALGCRGFQLEVYHRGTWGMEISPCGRAPVQLIGPK